MNNINLGQSKSMNSLQQVAKNSKTHGKQTSIEYVRELMFQE